MWIRSLQGDYVNLDNACAICVTTAFPDYKFGNHCVVYAEMNGCSYPLWAEKVASNDGRDFENVVGKANLFMDALVQRLNSEE